MKFLYPPPWWYLPSPLIPSQTICHTLLCNRLCCVQCMPDFKNGRRSMIASHLQNEEFVQLAWRMCQKWFHRFSMIVVQSYLALALIWKPHSATYRPPSDTDYCTDCQFPGLNGCMHNCFFVLATLISSLVNGQSFELASRLASMVCASIIPYSSIDPSHLDQLSIE